MLKHILKAHFSPIYELLLPWQIRGFSVASERPIFAGNGATWCKHRRNMRFGRNISHDDSKRLHKC